DAICRKATMFDPAQRYATARELGNAVQAFLDGDRDVALRRELAAAELTKARDALARGNAALDRRDAMRAAGRALALEPSDRAAGALVARLMIEPPQEMPDEVHAAMELRELDTLAATRRLIWQTSLTSLIFIPIFLWAGIDSVAVLGTSAAGMLVAA